ncbi:hypothetical protein FXO38_05577 [Capsicum annuum]|nr:hypothetical protein FXO37_27369 [Capsicum annuum]KAF3673584.1 hypothetical protein FXO38_05577 [Capsicum annuum]
MSESYELNLINVPTFSNFEQGGTLENELKNEDDYGVVTYPPYSEKFIDYIETSVPNLKCRGQALATKIITLEQHFLTLMNMAARMGYYPEIIHPVSQQIFFLCIALWD